MYKSLTLPTTLNGADDLLSIGDPTAFIGQIAKGATDYYTTLNTINAAKYGAQLAKAQAQAAVAAAKAGGVNAAETARAGLPSPTLILVGVLGLAAIVLLRK